MPSSGPSDQTGKWCADMHSGKTLIHMKQISLKNDGSQYSLSKSISVDEEKKITTKLMEFYKEK